ncbi:glycerol-3-phosphate dehydrogenase (NAD(P)+) [Actimicrobium sp. GrIS 1.19]|uniref:NAD(P)H-dependent glycerol-3-phosphate dehydrogenase n=1 Tax=Actimicrobium sp. GrIS 1.19 TaxID=3071708 RepID=UPI002E0167ED|nr:glycerol-3-phosphate dehydrogenase (NAD(P)+) [Actimicrobium sp. GrIS 1.19]
MNISILGPGAWGTALAVSLAERHAVMLWTRDPKALQALVTQRENTAYLPGIALPSSLLLSADLNAALSHCTPVAGVASLLIIATSVAGLRPMAERLQSAPIPSLVWLCKGFEEGTGLLPHQVVRAVLGPATACGALSGPSFALEVARGLPAALVVASADLAVRDCVVQAIHGPRMRVYATDDVIGVEVGGAVKNILAIATGVVDGLGLGMNARAALITRGLAEITRLGVALGGRAETFMGLAGMGDLLLTCTGDLSRNRRVGLGLAQGKPLDTIVQELGHVAEGVRCAQTVHSLAVQLQVDMPITAAVAGVLFDGLKPQEMVTRLLARDARNEVA